MRFEWDDDKAQANVRDHDGVTFAEAVEVFFDEYALEEFDDTHSEHEPRFIRIGMARRGVLFVVFTERQGDVTRIISARKAEPKERRLYEQQREEG
jgi:uncharacterized DUF497 family protein